MKNWLIVIVAQLILVSCNKRDKTVYLSEKIKNGFSFNRGSYWIYRDSISGREDSCYVTSSQLIIGNYGLSTSTQYELLILNYKQIPKDTSIKDSIDWQLTFYDKSLKIAHVRDGDLVNQLDFGYPVLSGTKIFSNQKFNCTSLFLDNYAVGTNFYKDVSKINFQPILNPNNFSNTYFLKDSVGLLKMCLNYNDSIRIINEVWELQRWNVIK